MAEGEGISSELTLDITSALRSIDDLETAITSITTDIPVTADTSLIADAITSAVDAVDPTVPVEADAAPVTAAIDDAVAAADATVPVEADASDVTSEIDQAIQQADSTIQIEADTSGADAALGDLSSSADEATASVKSTGTASAETSKSIGLIEAAALGAEGSARGMSGALGELGASGKAAGLVLGSVAAVTAGLFEGAVKAAGAEQRLESTFGNLASSIQTINVGGLDEDLTHLAQSLGTTKADIDNTASTLQQFGINAGFTADEAEHTTEQFIALAARAVALNPSLGSVSDVADTMATRLARGGRFAQALGISLTSAEINARALADTGKTVATDLTIYEKAAAAADLATEKYGDTLKRVIEEGTANPVIQLRALRAEFQNALETIGQPLIAPVFEVLESALPVATHLAEGFAGAAQALLPILDAVLKVVGLIPSPVISAGLAFLAMNTALGALSGVVEGMLVKLGLIPPAALAAAGAEEVLAEETAAAGDAMALADPIIFAAAVAFAGLVAVLGASSAAHARHEAQVKAATQALIEESGALTDDAAAWTKYITEQSRFSAHDQIDDLDRMNVSITSLRILLGDGAVGFDAFAKSAQKSGEIVEVQRNQVGQLVDAHGRLVSASEQVVTVNGRMFTGNTKLLTSFKDEQKNIEDASEKALIYAVAAGTVTQAQVDAAKSGKTWTQAEAELSPQLNAADAAATAAADSAARHAREQQAATEQAQAYADALANLGDTAPGVQAALDGVVGGSGRSVESFNALAVAIDGANLSADQMGAIAERLGITTDQLSGFVDAATATVGEFTDEIIKGMPDATSAIDDVRKAAEKVPGSFDPAKLIGILNANSVAIANYATNIGVLLAAGLPNIAAHADELGSTVIQNIVDELNNGQGDIVHSLDQSFAFNDAVAAGADATGQQYGQAVATGSAKGITAGQGEINAAGLAAADEVVTRFGERASTGMSGAGTAAVGAAGAAVTAAKTDVTTPADSVGTEGANAFGDAFGSAKELSKAVMQEVKDAIDHAKPELFASGDAAGRAISGGMEEGILVGKAGVISAAVSVAHAAAQAASDALGIHSPSTVFTEIGENITAGLVAGITGTTADVAAAMTAAVDAAVSVPAPTVGVAASSSRGSGGDVIFQPGAIAVTIPDASPETARAAGVEIGKGIAATLAQQGILADLRTI